MKTILDWVKRRVYTLGENISDLMHRKETIKNETERRSGVLWCYHFTYLHDSNSSRKLKMHNINPKRTTEYTNK